MDDFDYYESYEDDYSIFEDICAQEDAIMIMMDGCDYHEFDDCDFDDEW